MSSYSTLHEECGISKTPKFHVIEAHLKYYIDSTKKSLGFYSDSLIESMGKSNYHVRNVEAEIQGENLLQADNHLNVYNSE